MDIVSLGLFISECDLPTIAFGCKLSSSRLVIYRNMEPFDRTIVLGHEMLNCISLFRDIYVAFILEVSL